MTVKNMVYIIVLGVFYLFLIQEGRSVLQSDHYADRCCFMECISYLMRTGWKVSSEETQRAENTAAVRF